MLKLLLCFTLTWIIVALLVWYFSDILSFKNSLKDMVTVTIMIAFGWVPTAVVAFDIFDNN